LKNKNVTEIYDFENVAQASRLRKKCNGPEHANVSGGKKTNMEVPVKHSNDLKLASECLRVNEFAWKEFLDKYKGLCFYLAKKYNSENEFEEPFSDFIIELLGSPIGKKGALRRYDGSGSHKSFIASVFRFVLIDR